MPCCCPPVQCCCVVLPAGAKQVPAQPGYQVYVSRGQQVVVVGTTRQSQAVVQEAAAVQAAHAAAQAEARPGRPVLPTGDVSSGVSGPHPMTPDERRQQAAFLQSLPKRRDSTAKRRVRTAADRKAVQEMMERHAQNAAAMRQYLLEQQAKERAAKQQMERTQREWQWAAHAIGSLAEASADQLERSQTQARAMQASYAQVLRPSEPTDDWAWGVEQVSQLHDADDRLRASRPPRAATQDKAKKAKKPTSARASPPTADDWKWAHDNVQSWHSSLSQSTIRSTLSDGEREQLEEKHAELSRQEVAADAECDCNCACHRGQLCASAIQSPISVRSSPAPPSAAKAASSASPYAGPVRSFVTYQVKGRSPATTPAASYGKTTTTTTTFTVSGSRGALMPDGLDPDDGQRW